MHRCIVYRPIALSRCRHAAGASRPSRLPVVSSCASSGSSSLPVRYVSLPPRRSICQYSLFVAEPQWLLCLFASVCVCLFAAVFVCFLCVFVCSLGCLLVSPPLCRVVLMLRSAVSCHRACFRGNSQRTVAAVMRSERNGANSRLQAFGAADMFPLPMRRAVRRTQLYFDECARCAHPHHKCNA